LFARLKGFVEVIGGQCPKVLLSRLCLALIVERSIASASVSGLGLVKFDLPREATFSGFAAFPMKRFIRPVSGRLLANFQFTNGWIRGSYSIFKFI
jgi:hypothetical protein